LRLHQLQRLGAQAFRQAPVRPTPPPRCTTPRSPSCFTRTSSFLTQRSLIPNRCAAARCVKCLRFTSCKTFSRSRSFVLNTSTSCLLIRPVCRFRTGTFYFAGIGTSHFAATARYYDEALGRFKKSRPSAR